MAAETYNCIQCKKKREGRFTRRREGVGGGWSQGHALPYWYCYKCLPYGGGRDEEMTVTKGKPIPQETYRPTNPVTVTLPKLAEARTEGLALITPIQDAITDLDVTDAASYEVADGLLGRVMKARKTWGERMERIIRPIRQGLDELYGLNREVDKPLETLEKLVKGKMKAFKEEELRQLRAAEEEKRQREEKLRLDALDLAAKAAAAKTPQMRGKLSATANRLVEQAAAVAEEEIAAPVTGTSSSTRIPKKVRIGDEDAFYAAVAGYAATDMTSLNPTLQPPRELVTINLAKLNTLYRSNPALVLSWPGVEEYDDIQIVGR